jgi:feruloyl esterase
MKLLGVIFAAILMNMLSSLAYAQKTCESLSSLSLPETTITIAQTVAPGEFTWPHDFAGWKECGFLPCLLPEVPGDTFKSLPAFCRIAATLKPTSDSDIKTEIWMPVSGWNGKLLAVGNGGWAGSISYADMGAALLSGYAVASTDTGHNGNMGEALRWDTPKS